MLQTRPPPASREPTLTLPSVSPPGSKVYLTHLTELSVRWQMNACRAQFESNMSRALVYAWVDFVLALQTLIHAACPYSVRQFQMEPSSFACVQEAWLKTRSFLAIQRIQRVAPLRSCQSLPPSWKRRGRRWPNKACLRSNGWRCRRPLGSLTLLRSVST
jgi:hypothetical protein